MHPQPIRFALSVSAVLSAALIATQICGSRVVRAEPSSGPRGMVATVHPLATEAGVAALERGGNAIDAAVSAALMLGVVDGFNSGLGGGCFVLIRKHNGELVAIDGREMAPQAAHRDMFLQQGQAKPEWSRTGPLASGVPGTLAAWAQAVGRHGKLGLPELLEPAASVARDGFVISQAYAGKIRHAAKDLSRFAGSRDVLLDSEGAPWKAGHRLRQTDLAATYEAIAERGIGWYYHGPFAQRVGRWMSEHGGIMTADDFARYQVKSRRPIVTSYRGYQIVGFPPPSSGGIHVAQILNTLEHFDLAAMYTRDRAAFTHVIAEAMKAAFADRAHWLGDADFANVPRGLIDKPYAARLAQRIDPERVTAVASHGHPSGWETDLIGDRHTTHIAAADSEGNWVAITATVNTTFGSKVIVPGTGVVLNNQMDDFSIQPGVPNAFNLIGAEANAVAPGKRPLSSMSPTIVLKDGQPVMTVGAAGGPKIITQVVLAIINHIDLNMPIQRAISAKRFHHQWTPDRLLLETGTPQPVLRALLRRGHKVVESSVVGITQAITFSAADQLFYGVHDPRVAGQARGR